MNNRPLVSICIPAFGRLQYVRRTLTTIYNEAKVDSICLEDFEVILSDNDPQRSLLSLGDEFPYRNFAYHNPTCEGFMNSFYALSFGHGELLKLHNSQELFNKGSLKAIIDSAYRYRKEKCLLFFSSGLLEIGQVLITNSFDEFIDRTSYFSSWSNAFAIWKEDFDRVKNIQTLNKLFPHTSLLFSQTNKSKYIIDDRPLFTTQFIKKRGGHNKFEAFTIEYPSILDCSVIEGAIQESTRLNIIKSLRDRFLPQLYFNVKIAKRETFASDGFKTNIKKYFPPGSYKRVQLMSIVVPFATIWRKVKIIFYKRVL
jgi:hypothetical protein